MKVPSKIGRYRVERLLGQGAMGQVYLGTDPSLDREVAIKTVKDLDLDEPRKASFLERFKNEARAAARLSHPAIVAVYDVGEEEGVGPYLVFEYVRGSSLKHILRSRGALPPEETLRIGAQIAGAIDTAHAAGIIHRDVKPDNILVSEDGRAKLADFGVARLPDAALTKEGQFLGTPCYAAPETLSAGRYGPESDLFSFAAVLYELVCGVRAFPGDDAITVAHAVIHDEPLAPSEAGRVDVARGVDAVILRGLSKDKDERWSSASEMVLALEDALAAAGLVERGAASAGGVALVSPPRAREGGSAYGWLLAGALVVGVALVLALGGVPLAQMMGGGGGADDAGVPLEAGTEDAGVGARVVRERDAATQVAEDASVAIDTGPPDAGPPDTGLAAMSRQEREDLAKDAIDAARAAIAAGDRAEARRQLARARELDPESSDIEEVEALLGQ